jgi:hypothetical protein
MIHFIYCSCLYFIYFILCIFINLLFVWGVLSRYSHPRAAAAKACAPEPAPRFPTTTTTTTPPSSRGTSAATSDASYTDEFDDDDDEEEIDTDLDDIDTDFDADSMEAAPTMPRTTATAAAVAATAPTVMATTAAAENSRAASRVDRWWRRRVGFVLEAPVVTVMCTLGVVDPDVDVIAIDILTYLLRHVRLGSCVYYDYIYDCYLLI